MAATTSSNAPFAVIQDEKGKVVFEQHDVEIPAGWSQLATNVVVSKYFRGALGSPEREYSVRQMIGRVVRTIRGWGEAQGYFASPEETARLHEGCRSATAGCVDSKRALAENMVRTLAPIREKAEALRADRDKIRQVLGDGAQVARKTAAETMRLVWERVGQYR